MGEWRRFDGGAVLFETLRAVRGSALPIVVLVVLGAVRGGLDVGDLLRSLGYLVLGGAVATVYGVVQWRTTLWTVTATDVRRREGVLRRRERSVPLARVQSLDGVVGPLQRLLGVVTLHVQSSGGGESGEIVLTAVTPLEVRRLHELVGSAPPAAPDGPLRRLTLRELLVTGLTAGQAGVVLAAGGVVAQVVNQAAGTSGPRRELDTLRDLAPHGVLGWSALVAVLLALSWIVSIAGAVATYAGFTLARDGDRLRIRRGLVSRRESVVPVARVQAIRVDEGLLRQPFGLAAVRVESLGYGKEPSANRTLFPLVRRAEIPRLLAEFVPEHAGALTGLQRVPGRAWVAYAAPLVAGALAAGVALALIVGRVGWWAPAALAGVALALGTARWHASAWRLGDDGRVALRSRRLVRATLLFSADRVQTTRVGQGPLQRRARLAAFSAGVGPSSGGVRNLDADVAWRLWEASRPPDAGVSRPTDPALG